jgi:hypothetical protein
MKLFLSIKNSIFILVELGTNSSNITINGVTRSSRLDKVECRASNGYGAAISRTFKINIKCKLFF